MSSTRCFINTGYGLTVIDCAFWCCCLLSLWTSQMTSGAWTSSFWTSEACHIGRMSLSELRIRLAAEDCMFGLGVHDLQDAGATHAVTGQDRTICQRNVSKVSAHWICGRGKARLTTTRHLAIDAARHSKVPNAARGSSGRDHEEAFLESSRRTGMHKMLKRTESDMTRCVVHFFVTTLVLSDLSFCGDSNHTCGSKL